ncbi:MAG: type II toxin-antitoxin system RelE family toxin [Methylococcales bacterium]
MKLTSSSITTSNTAWAGRRTRNDALLFKPRVGKDLRNIPKEDQARILAAVERLSDGLGGDIRRLTSFTPEYRLRVGNYRVLFEVVANTIIIYRVLHRREAYR